MKHYWRFKMRFIGFLLFTATIILMIMGCSSAGTSTAPETESHRSYSSEHVVWGAFDLSWDGVSDKMAVSQSRQLAGHYNITSMLSDHHITIYITGWDPVGKIMTLDVTLENPVDLDGYDVRGVITNAGNAVLVNPDDYTKLFDFNDPPVANPFRAYAKDETNRKFWGNYAEPDQYIKTETFEMYFPDIIYAIYFVTAAWPGNAPEPYDIVDIQQSGTLYETSGSIDVTIEVLDWQDVTAYDVVIEANPVTVNDVHLTQADATHWETTITNTGGVLAGEYEVWVAAYDEGVSYALYNKFTIEVVEDLPPWGWGDPILISGETSVDEILPRIALLDDEYWVIYTEGTAAVGRNSTDGGYTWSAPTTIGTYAGIDTIHAVVGGDNGVYIQYQHSNAKYTYVSKYNGTSWEPPVETSYHALTTQPWSCDLGIGADGHLYDMTTGDWSTFGFRSNFAYEITTWTSDPIESFYNGVYSINDGFVQQATTPKFFFIHDDTNLNYAWYDGGWDKASAMTGTDTLIEPAIAPETDSPYHGVIGIDKGASYDVEYFRYDSWPPSTAYIVSLATGLTEKPVFHSISVKGDIVSILYDADGEVRYAESNDGGDNFDADVVLGAGVCAYSHIRHDPNAQKIIAVYGVMESGDYNIYARIKS